MTDKVKESSGKKTAVHGVTFSNVKYWYQKQPKTGETTRNLLKTTKTNLG